MREISTLSQPDDSYSRTDFNAGPKFYQFNGVLDLIDLIYLYIWCIPRRRSNGVLALV